MLDREQTRKLTEQARALGFDLCGVAPAAEFAELKKLPEWLARGYSGEMKYLHDPRRARAEHVLGGVRSIIVCALNYNTAPPDSTDTESPEESNFDSGVQPRRGWISRYAWGDDYHDVLCRKLDELIVWMRGEFGLEFRAKAYVDTGPVLERVAAKYAGLGWLGKNTCLINQRLGSWLFLGVILTDLELGPSLAARTDPPPDLCGTCRRCIEACPTDAIVEPYVLDARRCISYLTIELRGSIPEEFRPAMGNMVFGCDICQDVCPWNRKVPASQLQEFQPRPITTARLDDKSFSTEAESSSPPEPRNGDSLLNPSLEWLLSLSEDEFRRIFSGSAVKRAKWRGLLRNACVALGNSGLAPGGQEYSRIMQRLRELEKSEEAIISEHAHWALGRLGAAPVIPPD